ncbi:MAG: amidase family protein [Bacillus subtilis]|nr:amidase family protein [Bacillus subtilis]
MDEGLFTSVELCELYLEQIARLNPQLNAVAELNIEWRQIAEQMDLELKLSGPRSPLHGIPIAVKDNINTADKMHTTAGSLALGDLYADKDAFIIAKLRTSRRDSPRQGQFERIRLFHVATMACPRDIHRAKGKSTIPTARSIRSDRRPDPP